MSSNSSWLVSHPLSINSSFYLHPSTLVVCAQHLLANEKSAQSLAHIKGSVEVLMTSLMMMMVTIMFELWVLTS